MFIRINNLNLTYLTTLPMIKIQQFIKMLNNRELKKEGKQYHILLPENNSVLDMFNGFNNAPLQIINKNSNIYIPEIRHQIYDNRKEITGIGLRDLFSNLNAGDEILIERRDVGQKVEFYIDLNIKSNLIIFQKDAKGFLVLNNERLSQKLINGIYECSAFYNGTEILVKIEFTKSDYKNKGSSEQSNFYNISINGKNLSDGLKSGEYIKLQESEKENHLKKVIPWQKYEFSY